MSWKGYMVGYREGIYSHPAVLLWRLLWFVPLQACRVVTCAVAFCGWGRSHARNVWEDLS